MIQEIKGKIKIPVKQSSIKIAFQANIFKYIQKRKQQASIFSISKNKKFTSFQKDEQANSSNLIQKKQRQNTHFKNTLEDIKQLRIESTKKMNLTQRKFHSPLLNKKKENKGYKSCLSDWRNLYGERDDISHRNTFFSIQKQKMNATDRLFYPSDTKQKTCRFQKKLYNKNLDECKTNLRQAKIQNNITNNKMYKTISNFPQRQKAAQMFNDQNFFHLYHRSHSPNLIDFGQRKRIFKFIDDYKNRKRSSSGLRLMNEGIFFDKTVNDLAFVPYNSQQTIKQVSFFNQPSSIILQNYTNICIKQNEQSHNLPQKNAISKTDEKKNIEKASNRKKIELQDYNNKKNSKQQSQGQSMDDENPQQTKKQKFPENSNNKVLNSLSEILSDSLMSKNYQTTQRKQLQLKLFKARKNKIQKGIFNANKFANQQTKFANFQYSLNKPKTKHVQLYIDK